MTDAAAGVRRLVIRLTTPLAFNPGQYVQLRLPGGDWRPYSVASSPASGSRIELHGKRSPGGVATDGWIFGSLTVGEEVRVSGPYGKFSFRPLRTEPLLMLGSGTGSEVMRRIAAPMVGGMVTSTVLTLLVIPVIYAMVKGRGRE